MKILLADDHPLIRDGIRYVVQRIGRRAEVFEACDYAQTKTIVALQPDLDLILLDLHMPGQLGFEGLRCIRLTAPAIPLVILSASCGADDILTALDLGVSGYIPKSCDNEILLSAIQLVLSGGLYLPPELLGKLSNRDRIGQRTVPVGTLCDLTDRQREILSYIVTGCSNKEIANCLLITEATVKCHITTLFKRLKARNRTEAVHNAIQLGFTVNPSTHKP